jgi:TrmH family RNA methyltransferase
LLYNQAVTEPTLIISLSNPLVKQARALRGHKARAQSGLFLVEGIHPVGEAVEAGWEVETLLYAPDLLTSDYAEGLIARAGARGLHCQPVSAKVMGSLAEKENPQGLLALVKQRAWRLEDFSPGNLKWGVALISPQDPGNLGAILRTIEAVGADGLIVLEGGVDPYHPTAVRASMGTLFWVPVIQASFQTFAGWARRYGYRLVGSSAHATMDYHQLSREVTPTILILGSEQKGLSTEQVAACDVMVSLPMRGRGNSLNLAVAAGILLYALGEKKT